MSLDLSRDRPAEGSVLDWRTLNRTLLARQFLLERVDAEPARLVEHLIGMQAQVPLDPYVGCWSRLRSFDPHVLAEELLERRLVRMTLLRATLHLIGARDALRLRPLLQPMLERAFASSAFARKLSGLDLGSVLDSGVELVEREPLTLARLRATLAERWPERDANALAYAVRYLVPLVQVTPRGVWGKTMQPTVTTLGSWLDPRSPESGATVDEYVLRYLRAFGPATPGDIRTSSWLRDVRPVIDRLRPRLRGYRDDRGRELYDVEDGVFEDAATPAPVRFLPQFDNVFLSHADRGRIMDLVKWDTTFAHRGCVLVDGFIAGSWKLTKEARNSTLVVEQRTRISAGLRAEVREEGERLLEFLAPDARTRRVRLGR